MEIDNTVKDLMKKPKEELEKGALDVIHARRKQLADIFFDTSKSAAEKNKVFDELELIHKYFNMGKIFKAKEKRGGIPAKPTRTPEEKKEDSARMISDLWPEAKKLALAEYPKNETGMPTKDGPIIVDKNEKQRNILTQVFLYSMVELYKQ